MSGKHFQNPYSGTQGHMVNKYYDGIKKQNEEREAKRKLQQTEEAIKRDESNESEQNPETSSDSTKE